MLGIADFRTYQNLVEQLPMKVCVPEVLRHELQQRGVTDVRHHDLRRSPRFRCCGIGIIAPAELDAPQILRQPEAQVIIADLSRRGIGILTHEQWFPRQEVSILMAAAEIIARIVQIRYVGPGCYNVGSIILNIRNYDQESTQAQAANQ
jgi:hypothetical protein